MMRRLIPSPPLSIALWVVWLLLNQSLHPATMLLGAVLAVVVPLLTKGLRPATVRMRKPMLALRLLQRVVVDLLASALGVARALLTRPTPQIRSAFVHVPLTMRDPNGLAVLAMILCLTPGTAWAELAVDRSQLLLHVFDVDDESDLIERIKLRYETVLMEIFES